MRRLTSAAVLLVLAGAACDAGHEAGAGPIRGGGHLLAQRVAGRARTIVSGPAQATYCPAESLLVVIALDRNWTGGFAIRVVLPLTAARDFQVQPSLGGLGSATAAFRPLNGGVVEPGVRGTVRLDPSTSVDGRFDIGVPDSSGTPVAIRGRLSRIPLAMLAQGSCART
jgi:hypothetical protein